MAMQCYATNSANGRSVMGIHLSTLLISHRSAPLAWLEATKVER